MSFVNLGLSAELLRAISEQGYTQPTPIQDQAIPKALQGQDILASAQTGTGKTAGFTLPILHRLSVNPRVGNRVIRALILTPTRELAVQIQESVKSYSKYLSLTSSAIFGGVPIGPQISQLRKGVDILIATPGRLLDHVEQRSVNLSNVEIFVLDEADRMLDIGFINDINKVLSLVPKQRQTLLFSATFNAETKKLADRLLKSPAVIEVSKQNSMSANVTQVIHPVDRERKSELLSHMIGSNNLQQVLVFTRTKKGADRLSERLDRDGIKAEAIHGNKSQGARTRALSKFKQNKIRVLVATDIAARGLDISQLPHVVNYELPNAPADYLHRIGRTGRAGNEGQAFSLVCVDEHKLLKDIESLVKQHIPKVIIPGYEPNPAIKAEPINVRSGRNSTATKQASGNRPSKSQKTSWSQPQSGRKSNSRSKSGAGQFNQWSR